MLLCLLCGPQVSACLNGSGLHGGAAQKNPEALQRSADLLAQIKYSEPAQPWVQRRNQLRKQVAENTDYRVRNDLAVALAHTGEAAEAVTILEQIEAEQPGLYNTASNLGTVYELTGNNAKALEWIKEGIKRNADSHEGTEWLHVRILEAKIALAADASWLDSHSILSGGPVEQKGAVSALGNRGEKLTRDQVKTALIYQLHERLQFVHPPNRVVAVLLMELGDVVATEATKAAGAAEVIELAGTYLHDLPEAAVLEMRQYKQLLSAHNASYETPPASPQQRWLKLGILIIGGVVLAGIVIVGIRRSSPR